jgi:hypothetical protein
MSRLIPILMTPGIIEFIDDACKLEIESPEKNKKWIGPFTFLKYNGRHYFYVTNTPEYVPNLFKKECECFSNCMNIAVRFKSLKYCEGYVKSDDGYIVHHAWIINENNEVMDPTWEHADILGVEYFGFCVEREKIIKHMKNLGKKGIYPVMYDLIDTGVLMGEFDNERPRENLPRQSKEIGSVRIGQFSYQTCYP